MYQNLSDQLLLAKCSAGNPKAFHEFYKRYKKYVYAIVAARLDDEEDAKDITQEIFISLWANHKMLADIVNLKTYVYALSKNHVISAYRKQNIRIKGERYLTEQLTEIQHSTEAHQLAAELSNSITAAVDQFPKTMRSCYHLSRNEGKKNQEIAGMLNISEKTVRNNVSEALKRLRLTLKSTHPELLVLFLALFCR